MARIPDSFIDELLARTDIVALIGERIELKRAGREFHARCPFHDERTPSFTVSPAKQFYHCFGCAAHGTSLRFLMEYERLEFLDAVDLLSQRAGLTVPRETHARHSQGFEDLHAILHSATRFFQDHLAEAPLVRRYLEERGVDDSTAQAFELGYAPDAWDALRTGLGKDESKLRLLERVGLMSRSDSGRVYDKFRNRLIFPIEDRRGRVIAFGGRVLPGGDDPKYLNSPETPLFHKGRELFGLHRARQAKVRMDRLIVVEGYMDVVALAQAGITSVVATLGTAITPDQVELLFRNTENILFCFDGDRAGRSAATRAIENTLPRMRDGRQAHFLFLPEGQDPDSFVRAHGNAAFEQALVDAQPLSEAFFDSMSHDVRLDSLEGRARLAEKVRPLIEKIPDGAFRDLMRERGAHLSGVGSLAAGPEATSSPALRRISSPARTRVAPPSLVRTAVAMLVQRPGVAETIEPPYRFAVLRQPGIELLVELIAHIRSHPGIHTGTLLEHWQDREESGALVKLATQEFLLAPEQWQDQFLHALQRLDTQTIDQMIDDFQALSRQRPLSDAENEALRQLLSDRMKEQAARSAD